MDAKLWKDLTDQEKIERLHEVVKTVVDNVNLVNTEVTKLKIYLNQIQKKETGWF